MIRYYYLQGNELKWEKDLDITDIPKDGRLIWVDLQSPGKDEIEKTEKVFSIELFTPQEAEEIESSSRYLEGINTVEANNTFIVYENQSYVAKQVSFILKGEILFTVRNADLKSFAETVRKLKGIRNGTIRNGSQIWILLLETRIDLDADFIEYITRQTNHVSRKLLKERSFKEEILIRITELQEYTILIRESIIDKQRVVSSLLKSAVIKETEKEHLRILIKDVGSLLTHTQFSFERLEYLQNTFLGLVNIEQNQVIKIFTVVTVIFMPPTLIASLYGMNFKFIPELHWQLGYPFALGLMVLSSLGFLWYFRHKKWL
jgi:magnesium transporter